MKNRIRYTLDEVLGNLFYPLPQFLFEGECKKLSNDARVLYSLLKNRHQLSIKNEWYNEKKEIYLIMKREEMESMLGLSAPTVRKALEELKSLNLIEEVRQGVNKPNLLFLLECKNLSLHVKKFYTPECKNLSPINTNSKKKDFNKTEISIYPSETEKPTEEKNDPIDLIDTQTVIKTYTPEEVAEKICLDELREERPDENEEINLINDCICEILTVENPVDPICRISRQPVPFVTVKNIFAQLDKNHVGYVIDCLNNNGNKYKINKNTKSYIMTSLFHAPRTISHFHKRDFKKPEPEKSAYTAEFAKKWGL